MSDHPITGVSRLSKFLGTLSEDRQMQALQIIKDEHDRLERGEYTQAERESNEWVQKAARQMAAATDRCILEAAEERQNKKGKQCQTK